MSDLGQKILANVVTVIFPVGIACFAVGWIAGQQAEKMQSGHAYQDGFEAGADHVSRMQSTFPPMFMSRPKMPN